MTAIYEDLETEFNKYIIIIIGSCNDGDPIVTNAERNDKIEYHDHQDYFSSRPFNLNINSLAECLIIYRNFVSNLTKEKRWGRIPEFKLYTFGI